MDPMGEEMIAEYRWLKRMPVSVSTRLSRLRSDVQPNYSKLALLFLQFVMEWILNIVNFRYTTTITSWLLPTKTGSNHEVDQLVLDLEHSAVKTTCNSRVFPSPLQSKSQASRLVSYPISNWQHMPGPNVPEIFESVEKWHVILNGFNGISEDSTFCWNASVCKASEAHHFKREFCFPTQSLPLIMPGVPEPEGQPNPRQAEMSSKPGPFAIANQSGIKMLWSIFL